MTVHVTARFAVRPESLDQCRAAIRDFVAYVEANEPDTHLYVSLHESDDETRFLHYFVFEDDAAQERHASSEGVQRFTGILYPELVAPVEFTRYEVLATTQTNPH
jgi:quinol monooxygenase YgiN